MGVKNLNSLIEKYSPNGKLRQHLSVFNGMTFAVDTNVYLYKYLYAKLKQTTHKKRTISQ